MSSFNPFFQSSTSLSPEVIRSVPKISAEDVRACDERWPIRHLAEEAVYGQFVRDYPIPTVQVEPNVSPQPAIEVPIDAFDSPAFGTGSEDIAPVTDIDWARKKVQDAMTGSVGAPRFNDEDFLNASGL
ncbi:MAG: hypothetical protein QG629_490 [Patescibacteria group bacterium]|nr:hypothetical protein [Candidatus Saccharibacteria bacterium]MDQ5963408.1 hypothetical protein [Patescibacteria group bacterium]